MTRQPITARERHRFAVVSAACTVLGLAVFSPFLFDDDSPFQQVLWPALALVLSLAFWEIAAWTCGSWLVRDWVRRGPDDDREP